MAMFETNLTHRQNFILNIINSSNGIGRTAIEKQVASLYPASKPTIARDLAVLLKRKDVRVEGRSKSTLYFPLTANPLFKVFDLEQYFALDPDRRVTAKRTFEFAIFDHLKELFSKEEVQAFETLNKRFSETVRKLEADIYRKELERFIIELSWKSSKIEGNTYSLLETEILIKQSLAARGRSREEATMILNHKRAFETILKNRSDFKTITLSQITQLHNMMVKDLSISPGIREQAVGITGTTYKPLDNKWQIHEALEKSVLALRQAPYPVEKALIATAMISYIQPFSDGNKRTGRMLANAILLAHDYYPLSYRSVDEATYKKAVILFFEQHNLYHLKQIFVEQYRFALDTYFQS
jgi:fido (protein-threonine AMPylation protein)